MPRTVKEAYDELASRLDHRRREVEALRDRIRTLEAETANLHGFGAAIRWLVPSAISLIALVVVLHDRYIKPQPPVEQDTVLGEVFISASGNDASPWIYTGFRIVPGNHAIEASGRATMAVHHIIGGAKTDYPPTHPWLGPNGLDRAKGIPPSSPDEKDKWRLQHLLLPESKGGRHGMLLAYVGVADPVVRAPELFPVGSFGQISTDNSGGNLWLAINDVWLDPEALDKLAKEPRETKEKRVRFQEMKNESYFKAWFDDNAGGYLVKVIEKKDSDV